MLYAMLWFDMTNENLYVLVWDFNAIVWDSNAMLWYFNAMLLCMFVQDILELTA